MSTILITGGTGLVGTALCKVLVEKGFDIIILSRTKRASQHPQISYATWNIEQQTIDVDALQKADAIIHLAGAGVAEKRWTQKRKQEIIDSRVNSSKLLVNGLKQVQHKVKVLVSASAIGWYGPDPANHIDGFHEADAPHEDFLGNTCKAWEQSIEPLQDLGIRLVKFRTGIVLSQEGGALKEFLKPIQLGVAAILGSGKQVISWIHIQDMCSMYVQAISNKTWQGSYNAVAPIPVSNKELTLALAKQVRKKFYIPIHVPSFLLKLILGEMSIEVLKSTTVSSKKIETAGFSFQYSTIQQAVVSF
jgi:uncharacterized protein (TIGR01777 family)